MADLGPHDEVAPLETSDVGVDAIEKTHKPEKMLERLVMRVQ
jgi:hypothetical protein